MDERAIFKSAGSNRFHIRCRLAFARRFFAWVGPLEILTVRGLKLRNFYGSLGVLLISILFAPAGCCHRVAPTRSGSASPILFAIANGLTPPVTDEMLKSIVNPPLGWKPQPPKNDQRHRHEVWLSPTGDTAYGVIYFDLPLPVGLDLTLWGFLREMKKTQGEANLIFKRNDDTLPGLRFMAEGGPYTIRCTLQVDGFHGWIVYAGTLRGKPINANELAKAELARDQTRVDLP